MMIASRILTLKTSDRDITFPIANSAPILVVFAWY